METMPGYKPLQGFLTFTPREMECQTFGVRSNGV